MYALVTVRKGTTLGVVVSESQETLKAAAQKHDGAAPLAWQDFGFSISAHSERDDELGYSIYRAGTM